MQQLPERGVVLGVVRLQRHRRPKRILSLAQLATPLRLEATLAVAARLVARAPAARPRAVPPYPLLEEGCSRRVSQPRVPVGQRPAKGCVAQPTVHQRWAQELRRVALAAFHLWRLWIVALVPGVHAARYGSVGLRLGGVNLALLAGMHAEQVQWPLQQYHKEEQARAWRKRHDFEGLLGSSRPSLRNVTLLSGPAAEWGR